MHFSNIIVGNAIFPGSNEHDESESKIWYYQDRYRETPEEEVDLDTNNNVSYSRVYTTPEFSLVIKNLSVTDAGIYRCHGKDGQEEENKYNYRIEREIRDVTFSIFIFILLQSQII